MFTFGLKRFQKIMSSTTTVSKFIAFLLIVLLSFSSVSVASATETGEVASSSGYEFDYIDLIKEIRGYKFTTVSGLKHCWDDYCGPVGAYSDDISNYINPEYVLGGLSYDSVNDCYYVIFPEAVTIVEIIWDLTPLYNVGWDDAYLHFGLTWNGLVPTAVQGSEMFFDVVSAATDHRNAVDFGWGTSEDDFSNSWTPIRMVNILAYRISNAIENVPIINSGMTAFVCNGTHMIPFNFETIREDYTTVRGWAHNRIFGVGDHYDNQTNNFYSYADAGVFTVHLQHSLSSSDKYLSTVCGWNFIESNYFKLYDKQIVTTSSTDLSDIYASLTNISSNTASILGYLRTTLTSALGGITNYLQSIYTVLSAPSPTPTPSITPMPDIHSWLTPILNDANTYKNTYSNAVDFMKEETSYLYTNYQYIRYVLYFSGMGVCMVALFFTLRKRGG